ncbi:hypothetical protein AK830_g12099 [Neonectria ditissima]|uniref:Uncharacterized protein n=1 Tax=Neonectria ditissima TaxID=78410 RepID=A0A0P7B156_9HYPO|nr:hypothetical protein AK830_g12099 [Neonectria ditissima]
MALGSRTITTTASQARPQFRMSYRLTRVTKLSRCENCRPSFQVPPRNGGRCVHFTVRPLQSHMNSSAPSPHALPICRFAALPPPQRLGAQGPEKASGSRGREADPMSDLGWREGVTLLSRVDSRRKRSASTSCWLMLAEPGKLAHSCQYSPRSLGDSVIFLFGGYPICKCNATITDGVHGHTNTNTNTTLGVQPSTRNQWRPSANTQLIYALYLFLNVAALFSVGCTFLLQPAGGGLYPAAEVGNCPGRGITPPHLPHPRFLLG